MKTPLAGKVALVAGATRGAGRGIAVQLGAAGATVYVTHVFGIDNVNIGAPGGIRTPDFLVRSQALYPTELRARREGESVCRNERHSDPGARSVSY